MNDRNETSKINRDDCVSLHISCLVLSNRSKNALFRNGVFSTNDLLSMPQKEILNMRGVGVNILREIENALTQIGYALPEDSQKS